ncbi:MAG: tetratricopeptide repeat protein [Verrucomicrobiae bacterium]|nr:tetratricopeptide repeat protein [Verrucomicrobiae bacterium]
MVEKEKMPAPIAEESSLWLDFLAWFEVNKKKLLIAAVVLIAVWIGAVVIIHAKRAREEEASAALAALRPPLGQPLANAHPPSKYIEIAERYKGTEAAPRALILAATAYYQEGKYADAQKTYEQFLKEYSDNLFAPQAVLGVAAALEAQGKEAEALAKYQEVITRHSTEPYVLIPAKMAYARLVEKQGKFDIAYNYYNDVIKADVYTSWAQEAMNKMHLLEKAHPELAKPKVQQQQTVTITNLANLATNKPAVTATNAKAPTTNLTITLKTNSPLSTPAQKPQNNKK